MVKALDSRYEAGRRGAAWRKVKPVRTLDLVVLAAEWGHGRRRGWLSNLHLGARDPETGDFVMVGKTFKGLTDQLLTWQTEQLQAIADAPRRLHGLRAPGARRRDRARRRAGIETLRRWRRAALRARARLPTRQGGGRRRHHRRRSRTAHAPEIAGSIESELRSVGNDPMADTPRADAVHAAGRRLGRDRAVGRTRRRPVPVLHGRRQRRAAS